MVGKKTEENKYMSYSISVTANGQMTLPKALREKYGITTRVEVEDTPHGIKVKKAKTDRELLEELWALQTPKQRELIKRDSNKTVSEIREELLSQKDWSEDEEVYA